MLVIGLTGGIASGKSTVSAYLQKHHDLPIIDADHLARAVIEPGTAGYNAVVKHFGKRILQDDGVQLDRKAISDIVFNDEKERRVLNGIVHPAVRKAMALEVVRYWMRGHWACILDVPLLVEAGLYKWVGEVIVVYVNEALQLSRLQDRPSPNPNESRLTLSQAQARIRSQMPLGDKLKYADYVVDNSGTKPELEKQLDVWVSKIKTRSAGWKKTAYWLIPPVGLWGALVTLVARTWKRRQSRL